MARMVATLCLIKAFEGFPQATAMSTMEFASVKLAGLDELALFTLMTCAGAILVWELLERLGRWCWSCLCKQSKAKGQKASSCGESSG